jgi:hypothetical protein
MRRIPMMSGTMLWTLPQAYYISSESIHEEARVLATDLRGTPLETHHEAGNTCCAEGTTNVIKFAQYMASRVVFGQAGRILVKEDDEDQTNEVPDADDDAVVSPTAGLRDQLRIEYRGAERQDGEHHQSDILGAVSDRHDFTCTRKRDELVQACTKTREDTSSYPVLVCSLV